MSLTAHFAMALLLLPLVACGASRPRDEGVALRAGEPLLVSDRGETVGRSLAAAVGSKGILVVWTSEAPETDATARIHDAPYTPPTKIRARFLQEGTLSAIETLGMGNSPAAVATDYGFVASWLDGDETGAVWLVATKLTASGRAASLPPVRVRAPTGSVFGPSLSVESGRLAAYLCLEGSGLYVTRDVTSAAPVEPLVRTPCESSPLVLTGETSVTLAVVASVPGVQGGLGTLVYQVSDKAAEVASTVGGTAEALFSTSGGTKLLYSAGSDDRLFLLDVASGRKAELSQPGGGNRSDVALAATPKGLLSAWLARDPQSPHALNVALVSDAGRPIAGPMVVVQPYWWLDPLVVRDSDDALLLYMENVETDVFQPGFFARRIQVITDKGPR
jgi:hypothetical protein